MVVSSLRSSDPIHRLYARRDEWIAYLCSTFPALDRAAAEDLVHDALADPATLERCPADAHDGQLGAWFRRVLRNDAIDHLRRIYGRSFRHGESRLLPLDALTTGAQRDAVLAGSDPDLEAVDHHDEVESFRRVVDEALALADPDTASLLRDKLAGEKPAAIALARGWSRKRYERQLTRAYKRLEAIIADIQHGPHCASIRELLVAAQDGLLADASQRRISVHVETCVHCRAYRRQTLRQRVAALLPFPLPAFLERWLGRDAAELGTAAGGGTATAGLLAGVGGKAAATLCAGALVGGGCLALTQTAPRRDAATLRAATTRTASTPSVAPLPSSAPPLAASRSAAPHRSHDEAQRRRDERTRRADRRPRRRANATVVADAEFGPQPETGAATAASSPAPAAAAAAATPVTPPAPAAPPPARSAAPAAPTSSFSDEFAP